MKLPARYPKSSLSSRSFVKADECLFGAGTGVVDRLREDLFACSGFAREQHRRVRRGDFACQIHGLTERSGGTDDTVERMFVGHFCFKTRQTPLHLRFLRRTAQQRKDFVIVVSLGDIIERAVLDSPYSVGYIAVSRQKNHFGFRYRRFDFRHQIDSVTVG